MSTKHDTTFELIRDAKVNQIPQVSGSTRKLIKTCLVPISNFWEPVMDPNIFYGPNVPNIDCIHWD